MNGRADCFREERKKKAKYLTVGCVIAGGLIVMPYLVHNYFARQEAATEVNTPPPVVEEVKTGLAAIYYYEEDKAERYTAYQTLHPELSDGDVVWQVNAGLDYPFYENIQPADMTAPCLIVNKYYALASDYEPEDLVALPSGKKATRATAEAYALMDAAAKEAGCNLYATSAYRTYEYQNTLYNRYLDRDGDVALVDTYSARPGHSEHQTGMAIDLIGSFGSLRDFVDTPEGTWIKENCHQYGFIIRYQADNVDYTGYQDEPWHIRYVGTEISMAMHELGINTLEEYVVKYIEHQPPTTTTEVSTSEANGSGNAL